MNGPKRLLRHGLPALALAAVLTTLVACEERVVGTRNDWVGSQLDRVQPEQEKDATDEFFDDTGEALFGWTRHLTGEKKKSDRPTIGEVDLSDRETRSSTSTGSGW